MLFHRHRTRSFLAIVLLAPLAGCVKEISSEERLEQASPRAPRERSASAAELKKINCAQGAGLEQARNVNRPETDRIQDYAKLYRALRDKVKAFEDAMSRNPDLQYQEGSSNLTAAREDCVRETADVRLEFDRYVRELVDVPTVQEVKGGAAKTVARIDFDILRAAIDALDPEDKEGLLGRVTQAEQKLEARGIDPKPRRRRGGK